MAPSFFDLKQSFPGWTDGTIMSGLDFHRDEIHFVNLGVGVISEKRSDPIHDRVLGDPFLVSSSLRQNPDQLVPSPLSTFVELVG